MKILAAGLVALSTGACSIAVGVAGLQEEEPEVTGTIAPRAAVPLSPDLSEEDWRRAKAALAVAIDPQGPGTQVSWDNPVSGMKGAFTAAGSPFVKEDEVCRAFTAALNGASAASLSGTACRPSGGEWVIKDIRPAKAVPKV